MRELNELELQHVAGGENVLSTYKAQVDAACVTVAHVADTEHKVAQFVACFPKHYVPVKHIDLLPNKDLR